MIAPHTTSRRLISAQLAALLFLSAACSDDSANTPSQTTVNSTTNTTSNTSNTSHDAAPDADLPADSDDADLPADAGDMDPDLFDPIDAPVDQPTYPVNPNGQALCGAQVCACDNGLDDDGDGLIDGFDPECTGPYDDDEASFATGIPGDNRGRFWQDCFFDGNSGAGDDGCRYHTDCLLGDAQPDDPRCQLSDACRDFCAPRAPNGCDCFGCCEVFRPDGTSAFVALDITCSVDQLDDPSACRQCVPTDTCGSSACGTCELCPGRTLESLPAECFTTTTPDPDMGTTGDMGAPTDMPGDMTDPTPPPYTCSNDRTVCDANTPCPELGFYCLQGCCTLFQ